MLETIEPTIIAVAPNGAKKSKKDHPKLPITPQELADCAHKCAQAGATMIHLHVRDDKNNHSLSPISYGQAIDAVKSAVGESMMIQVTSESANRYSSAEQIKTMTELTPDFISIAIREYLTKDSGLITFTKFIDYLYINQTVIQYILYDFEDYKLYLELLHNEQIPNSGHSILVVLGRYSDSIPDIGIVKEYTHLLAHQMGCMVCTFGPHGFEILQQANSKGCHLRVGFENGLLLPNGELAKNNAELVQNTVDLVRNNGGVIADINFTRKYLAG